MIGVINFGLGNLGSIVNAFERIDCRIEIFQNPTKILNYDHLILPGVGSFKVGMNNLIKQNWNKAIYDYVDKGRPLLGICLGMQLIFETLPLINPKPLFIPSSSPNSKRSCIPKQMPSKGLPLST